MPPASFHPLFLGWDRPALHGAAERLLAWDGPGGRAGELDLSQHLVVVPGSRAGRRLQELLLEGSEARGLALRPPQVVTAGVLPERLYLPERPPPPGLAARMAWARALQELPDHRLRLLTSRPPAAGDLPGWLALARLVEELHRELAAEGLTFQDVAQVFARASLFDDGPRWDALQEVQGQALRLLARGGWMDREEARRHALADGSVSAPGPLWLVAIPELPGVVREMLTTLQLPVQVLIHAPESEGHRFHPDGTILPQEWWGREVPLVRARAFVEGGPADQAERVAREMADLGGRRSPEEVVVGVADPDLTPFLLRVLEERGVPLRDPAGRPLDRTRPFLLLEAVARFLDDDDVSALASLLRHPDLEGWLQGEGLAAGETLRNLDAYRQAALPGKLGGGSLPGPPEDRALRRVEFLRGRMGSLLGELRESRPLSEWAEPLGRFFQAIHGDRALRENVPGDRDLMAFLSVLRGLLGEAEAAGGAGAAGAASPGFTPGVSGATLIRILLSEMEGEVVPPPEEEAAVEALGWLELHLDDAPVLLLAGVNDPHLPAAVVGHPFLPDALRVALGIPDNRARRARDAYRLTAILESREGTVLVSGRRGVSGDPLRPSPLLLQGTPPEVARRILQYLDDKGEAPAAPGGAPPAPGSSPPPPDNGLQEAGVSLPPELSLAPPGPPLRIRVTAFASLLADPYLWLLGRRVGGASPDRWVDDEGREMEAMGFGGLAHRVLETLGRELRGEKDAGRLARGLEEALREEGRRRFGTRPLPAVQIQLSQLALRLGALARVEAAHRAQGWEVVAVETGTPPEGVPFPVDTDSVFLTGRVDRVDRHPEEGWLLLDYKTSEVGRSPDQTHRKGRGPLREWVDLQLPLYRHVAPRLVGAGGEPLEALGALREGSGRASGAPGASGGEAPGAGAPLHLAYYNLPRKLETVGILRADWTAEELAEADEQAREVLRPLLRGEWVTFDPARLARARVSDDMGPLLGVGILAPPSEDGEEGEEEMSDG